jgi:hypothetical protein
MSQGDYSGQQWLITMPSPAAGGYFPTQSVPNVHHDYSNSQSHHNAIGKIAGGLGTVYASHKLWNKLT